MRTDDLITRLAADHPPRQAPPAALLGLALVAGCLCAALAMLLSIGPRADVFTSIFTSWRFATKFVVTLTLAASAFLLLRRAIYPEGLARAPLWIILAAPLLLLAAVVVELALLPQPEWRAAAVGSNSLYCLTLVPAFGLAPLALGLWAVRQGASTRPVLTGFLVGLMSGGIAAFFYAAHCPDDSPLFVAAWYTIGILVLGTAGAFAGRRVLRW